jgi:sugar phosphate isomerase/epimerase
MRNEQKIIKNLGIQILFDFDRINKAVEFCLDNSINVLELNLNNIYFLEELSNKKARKELKRYLNNKPITIQFHAQEGLSFFVPETKVQIFLVNTFIELMSNAQEVSARSITFHLGTDMSFGMTAKKVNTYEIYLDYYREFLFNTLNTLKKHIPKNLYLCLENVGGFRYPFVLEMIPRLLGNNFALTLDIGHINRFLGKDKEREENFFYKHRQHIRNVHIHDNSGAWDEHNIIGEGNIDFRKYFDYLSEIDTTYIFEVRPKESALECLKRFDYLLKNWQ